MLNHVIKIGGAQKTIFPDAKNKFIRFKNFKNKIPAPFVVYADFEAINNKNIIEDHKSTEKLTNHQVCSYAYKLVCITDDKFSKPVKLYRGENAAYKFIEDMLSEEVYCAEMIKTHFNKTIIMTEPDKLDFANAKCCHICNVKYKPEIKEDIVKDHNRYTGKYKVSVHKTC